MIGAAQYIWWPRIIRVIVRICKECKECTLFGKNLKPINKLNSSKPPPLLNRSNRENCLDYAGLLSDGAGVQIYILVAIDRYSKYPSVMLTRTTCAKKILKFLKDYVTIHSIPKSIRTDQYSGFKKQCSHFFLRFQGGQTNFLPSRRPPRTWPSWKNHSDHQKEIRSDATGEKLRKYWICIKNNYRGHKR